MTTPSSPPGSTTTVTPNGALVAPPPTSAPIRARSRWKFWLAATLIALFAALIWYYPTLKAQAEVGAAYGARIGCSCVYVQGRDIASCRTDFEPGMEMVSIELVENARAIRASVPMLANRTARFEGPTGCVLDGE